MFKGINRAFCGSVWEADVSSRWAARASSCRDRRRVRHDDVFARPSIGRSETRRNARSCAHAFIARSPKVSSIVFVVAVVSTCRLWARSPAPPPRRLAMSSWPRTVAPPPTRRWQRAPRLALREPMSPDDDATHPHLIRSRRRVHAWDLRDEYAARARLAAMMPPNSVWCLRRPPLRFPGTVIGGGYRRMRIGDARRVPASVGGHRARRRR